MRIRNKNRDDNFQLACQLQKAGRFEEAIANFKISNAPDAIEPQIRIAKCYRAIEKSDLALQHLEALPSRCKTEKQKKRIYGELANTYRILYIATKDTNYLSKLKTAVDNHPDQSDPYMLFNLATYYYNMNQHGLMENAVQEIYKKYSHDDILMKNVKMLNANIKENANLQFSLEESQDILLQLEKVTTTNVTSLLHVARYHPRLIDLNKTPIISDHTLEDRLRVAQIYERLKMTDKAESEYKAVIENFPQHCKARLLFGHFLTQQTYDYGAALIVLLPIVNGSIPTATTDDLVNAYRGLAIASFDNSNINSARKFVESGLAIDSDDAVLNSLEGKCRGNRNGEAHKHFEKARRADKPRFNANHPGIKQIESKLLEEKSKESLPTYNGQTVQKDVSVSANEPRPIIGLTKVVLDNKPVHVQKRQLAVTSTKTMTQRLNHSIAEYESMIDYSAVSSSASKKDVPQQDKPKRVEPKVVKPKVVKPNPVKPNQHKPNLAMPNPVKPKQHTPKLDQPAKATKVTQTPHVLNTKAARSAKTLQRFEEKSSKPSLEAEEDVTPPSTNENELAKQPNPNSYSCSRFLTFAAVAVVVATPVILTAASLMTMTSKK